MKLEDIGIHPALMTEAQYAAHIKSGDCTIIVPCRSEDETAWVKQVGNEFFSESEEPDYDYEG